MPPPDISIIVPTYNMERFLSAALQSALSQSGAELEVIVVDDASTDGSAGIAASFASRDNRVRVVSLRDNHGLLRARLEGLKIARGRWVVHLDSDDELAPGACRALLEGAALVSGVEVVHGGMECFCESGRPDDRGGNLETFGRPLLRVGQGRDVLHRLLYTDRRGWNVCGKMFDRKALLTACRPFLESKDLFFLEDLGQFVLFCMGSGTYVGIDDVVYRYRVDSGGTIPARVTTRRQWSRFTAAGRIFATLEAESKVTGLEPYTGRGLRFLKERYFRWLLFRALGFLDAGLLEEGLADLYLAFDTQRPHCHPEAATRVGDLMRPLSDGAVGREGLSMEAASGLAAAVPERALVVVGDDGKLSGLCTEVDLSRAAGGGTLEKAPQLRPVEAVMNRTPMVVFDDELFDDVWKRMYAPPRVRLWFPVLDRDGRPVGALWLDDLVGVPDCPDCPLHLGPSVPVTA